MASGEVVIESMWSPAVAFLVTQGVNVKYAAPPEGFRGWSGGQGIAAHVTDPSKLQAVYDYLNWWLSGEPGGMMMRQGYYNAVQEPTREFVEPGEWDFWIDGKPAAEDLPGITGQVGDVKAGTVRDGGSFLDRACHYSSWNSHPEAEEYMLTNWNSFIAT
jgi:putative spermidine/putrescine transport system substrate-binding protein